MNTYLSCQQMPYLLLLPSLTLIARRQQCRRLLHHRLNYFPYRLKIFFRRLAKLVHVEVIPRKGILLDRFALI